MILNYYINKFNFLNALIIKSINKLKNLPVNVILNTKLNLIIYHHLNEKNDY
jgi:hypothetical protein